MDLLYLIAILIPLMAQIYVSTSYSKFRVVKNGKGLTGLDTAKKILEANGLGDLYVVETKGKMTDHYDPTRKTVRLSTEVFHGDSVASLAIAAHECGHAIQHAKNYAPLSLRSALVPVANFGSMLAWPLILIGLFINGRSSTLIIDLGIVLFSAAVLFQLVTLPVEFDASRRALVMLRTQNILSDDELKNTRKVLKSAAFTYVASAAAAILQLLRIILLVGGRRDDR